MIDQSSDTVFQMNCIEVNEQPDFFVRQLKVGKQLGFVDV